MRAAAKVLLLIIFVIILLPASLVQAQKGFHFPNQTNPPDPVEKELEAKRQKAANKDRQTKLQRDTDELLKMATELKASVEKTNENTLSLDVIKKAEQIEKLAHSVKVKMQANEYMPMPAPEEGKRQ